MKRFISMLLCVLMVVSVIPFSVAAEEEELKEKLIYENTFDTADKVVEDENTVIGSSSYVKHNSAGLVQMVKDSDGAAYWQRTFDISGAKGKVKFTARLIATAHSSGTAVALNGVQLISTSVTGSSSRLAIVGESNWVVSTIGKSVDGGVFVTIILNTETGDAEVTFTDKENYTQTGVVNVGEVGDTIKLKFGYSGRRAWQFDDVRVYTYVSSHNVEVIANKTVVDSAKVGDEESYTLPEAPVRYGYDFVGWTDGESTYAPGDSVVILKDKTFKAIYQLQAGMTAYQVNVLSDGVTVDTEELIAGFPYTLPAATEKEKHLFLGWSDGTTVYQPGDVVTINANTTFTASFTEIFTVNVEAEGELVDSDNFISGETYTLPAAIELADYYFRGWTDGVDTYAAGTKVIILADTTFTAVFEEKPFFTVTISYEGETFVTESVRDGNEFTFPAGIANEQYLYKNFTDGENNYSVGDKIVITGDVDFTAILEERVECAITVVSDAATVASATMLTGDTYKLPAARNKTGYYFLGWSDGKTLYAGGESVVVVGDTTYTAVFEAKPIYNITVTVDGEKTVDTTAYENDAYTLPAAPEKLGYKFLGWSDGENTYAASAQVTVLASYDFVAVYQAKELYTLSFMVDGEVVFTDTAYEGDSYVLPFNIEKEGYNLFSWSEGTNQYYPNNKITVVGSTTFLATFEEKLPSTVEGSFIVKNYTSAMKIEDPRNGYFANRTKSGGVFNAALDFTQTDLAGIPVTTAVMSGIGSNKYDSDALFFEDGTTLASDAKYITLRYRYLHTNEDKNLKGYNMTLLINWSDGSRNACVSANQIIAGQWGYLFFDFSNMEKDEGVYIDNVRIYYYNRSPRSTGSKSYSTTSEYLYCWSNNTNNTIKVSGGDQMQIAEFYYSANPAEPYKLPIDVNFYSDIRLTEESLVQANNTAPVLIEVPAAPEKEGYTFIAWRDINDADHCYQAGDQVAFDKSYNFYADYRNDSVADNEFLVWFDNNGGDGEVVEPYFASTVTMMPSMNKPSNRFVCWTDGTNNYNPGDVVTLTENTVFTAVFREVYYDVKADIDGSIVKEETILELLTFTLPEIPEKDTYTIKGWTCDGVNFYNAGDEIVVLDNYVFVATYTENFKDVVLKADGEIYDTIPVREATTFTFPEGPVDEYRIFKGWFDGVYFYNAGDEFPNVRTKLVFTAIYETKQYVLRVENEEILLVSKWMDAGSTYTIPTATQKDGREFLYWTDGTNNYDNGDVIIIKSDVTLRACYSGDVYTLTVYNEDGSILHQKDYSYDDKYILPTLPEKSGYVFEGWSNGKTVVPAGTVILIRTSAEYTPVYVPISWTVKVVCQGVMVSSATVVNGEQFKLPTTATNKMGYTLSHWTDGENDYAIGAKVTILGNVTFEAVYTEGSNEGTVAVGTARKSGSTYSNPLVMTGEKISKGTGFMQINWNYASLTNFEQGGVTIEKASGVGSRFIVSIPKGSGYPSNTFIYFDLYFNELPAPGESAGIFSDRSRNPNWVYDLDLFYLHLSTDENGVSTLKMPEGQESIEVKTGQWYSIMFFVAGATDAPKNEDVIGWAKEMGAERYQPIGQIKSCDIVGVVNKALLGFLNTTNMTYSVKDFGVSVNTDVTLLTLDGVQVSKTSNGVYSVRFVAAVKSLLDAQSSVGFIATCESAGKTWKVDTTTVYKSLLASYGHEEITAESRGAKYLSALKITNIPASLGTLTFVCTPYTVINGATYYGSSVTVVCTPVETATSLDAASVAPSAILPEMLYFGSSDEKRRAADV